VRLVAIFILATLVALAIQTVLPYWFPIRAFVPNLVLILAVDLGFRHPGAMAAAMAFAMGYATDALSGSHLGLNAFMVTLVFLLAYEISRRLLAASDLVGALTVFIGAMINAFGAFVLTGNFKALSNAGGAMMQRIVIQALITALLAPPVFSILRLGKQRIGLPLRNAGE
jgi:rod shape-determining protein MreD